MKICWKGDSCVVHDTVEKYLFNVYDLKCNENVVVLVIKGLGFKSITFLVDFNYIIRLFFILFS